jgi:hypothetical protein
MSRDFTAREARREALRRMCRGTVTYLDINRYRVDIRRGAAHRGDRFIDPYRFVSIRIAPATELGLSSHVTT